MHLNDLSVNHPTFALKNKINDICKGFFSDFGLNYFQIIRCFNDGSTSLLVNHTGLTEFFLDLEENHKTQCVYSSFKKEHENLQSYWFLWDEELPDFPVRLAREKFNLCNGLTLVRRAKDYYDLIAVATPRDLANNAGFYLNKLKGIEQFIYSFDKDHKDLIAEVVQNKFQLSPGQRDTNYQNICLEKGRLKINGAQGETYLTAQELSCLKLLFYGVSYKEIAQRLNISPRTVETYLKRIKERTGYRSLERLESEIFLGP